MKPKNKGDFRVERVRRRLGHAQWAFAWIFTSGGVLEPSCWPLYFSWHGIKCLCKAFSWYIMEYPKSHLYFLGIYRHEPSFSCGRYLCVTLQYSLLYYVAVKSKLQHPPGHTPGIWRLFPAREGGHLITTHRGLGNLIASLDVMLRVSLIPRGWKKSWRRQNKEKITCPWQPEIGWKPKAYTSFFRIWRCLIMIYISCWVYKYIVNCIYNINNNSIQQLL